MHSVTPFTTSTHSFHLFRTCNAWRNALTRCLSPWSNVNRTCTATTSGQGHQSSRKRNNWDWSTDQDYQLWKVLGWTVELEKRGFDDLTRIKERCSWCLCARRSPCTEHVSTLCQRQTGCKNEQFWVEAGVAWFSKYRRYIHITELMGKAVSFNSFTQPVFPLCRLLQLSSWRVWMRKRESPDDSIKLLLFTFPARFLLGYCLHMQ